MGDALPCHSGLGLMDQDSRARYRDRDRHRDQAEIRPSTKAEAQPQEPTDHRPCQEPQGNPLTLENLAKHTRLNPARAQRTVDTYLKGLQLPWADLDEPRHFPSKTDAQVAEQLRRSDVDTKRSRLLLQPHQSALSFPAKFQHVSDQLRDSAAVTGLSRSPCQPQDNELLLVPPSKDRKFEPGTAIQQSKVISLPKITSQPASHKLRDPTVSESISDTTGSQRSRQLRHQVDARSQQSSKVHPIQNIKDESTEVSQVKVKRHRRSKKIDNERSSKVFTTKRQPDPTNDAEEDEADRLMKRQRKLLQRRLEKRRARAVIIKDRTSIKQPSKAAVKANVKAKGKERSGRDDASPAKHKTRHQISKPDTRDRSREVLSIGSGSNCNFEKTKRRHIEEEPNQRKKKRRNDTERNVAIIRDAMPLKGRQHANRSVLDRAANIIPSGRVTVKAKTGIYNHGLASTRETVVAKPSLPDLAFDEFPFLNPSNKNKKGNLPKTKPAKQEDSTQRPVAKPSKLQHGAFGTEERDEQRPVTYPRPSPVKQNSTDPRHSSQNLALVDPMLAARQSCIRKIPPEKGNRMSLADHAVRSSRLAKETISLNEPSKPLHQLSRGLTLEAKEEACRRSRETENTVLNGSASAYPDNRSRHTSEGGLALSSLTGLSAASLARRKLLRQDNGTLGQRLIGSSTSTAHLNQQLRHFEIYGPTGPQSFGHTAKYGTAFIPQHAQHLPVNATPEEGSSYPHLVSGSHPHLRLSPDWFGSPSIAPNATARADWHFRPASMSPMHVPPEQPSSWIRQSSDVNAAYALRSSVREDIAHPPQVPLMQALRTSQISASSPHKSVRGASPAIIDWRYPLIEDQSNMQANSSVVYERPGKTPDCAYQNYASSSWQSENRLRAPSDRLATGYWQNHDGHFGVMPVDDPTPYQQGLAVLHIHRQDGTTPFQLPHYGLDGEERFWRPHYH